ncbi:MAG: bcrC [Evtepia sp.]|jgi:undecaprenyl-diphosphatase|nr:bcrC [Evtepia sp.]
MHWEFAIMNWIAEHLHSALLDQVMPVLTGFGDKGAVWILLGLILLCLPRERSKGIQVILALGFSFLLSNLLLKNLVARVRPFDVVPGIELLIQAPHDFSFPSGHTSASFAATMVLMMNHWKGRYYALGLAILIAFSRLYLYVHYPTDVLAGAFVGVGAGYLSVKVYSLLHKKGIGLTKGR